MATPPFSAAEFLTDLSNLCGQAVVTADTKLILKVDVKRVIADESIIPSYEFPGHLAWHNLIQRSSDDGEASFFCEKLLDSTDPCDNVASGLGSRFSSIHVKCQVGGSWAKPHPTCMHPTFDEAGKPTPPVKRLYGCSVCHFTAESIEEVLSHQRTVHYKLKEIGSRSPVENFIKGNCQSCSCSHILGRYSCRHCDFFSNCPFSLEAHMKDFHHAQQVYHCPCCDHEHRYYNAMERHVFERHCTRKSNTCNNVKPSDACNDEAKGEKSGREPFPNVKVLPKYTSILLPKPPPNGRFLPCSTISQLVQPQNIPLEKAESPIRRDKTEPPVNQETAEALINQKAVSTSREEPYLCPYCAVRQLTNESLGNHILSKHGHLIGFPSRLHNQSLPSLQSDAIFNQLRCCTCDQGFFLFSKLDAHYHAQHPSLYSIFKAATHLDSDEWAMDQQERADRIVKKAVTDSVKSLDQRPFRTIVLDHVTTRIYRGERLAAYLVKNVKLSRLLPKCRLCWKGPMTKVKMVAHLFTHTRHWPYSCHGCLQAFKMRPSAVQHAKSCESTVSKSNPSSGVVINMNELRLQNVEVLAMLTDLFQISVWARDIREGLAFTSLHEFWCEYCKYSCLDFDEMVSHMPEHLEKPEPFTCTGCEKTANGPVKTDEHKDCNAFFVFDNSLVERARERARTEALKFTTLVEFSLKFGNSSGGNDSAKRASALSSASVVQSHVSSSGRASKELQLFSESPQVVSPDDSPVLGKRNVAEQLDNNSSANYGLESVTVSVSSSDTNCGNVVDTPSVSSSHAVEFVLPKGKVKCRLCGLIFALFETFFPHAKTHLLAFSWICQICAYPFRTFYGNRGLMVHCKEMHPGFKPSETRSTIQDASLELASARYLCSAVPSVLRRVTHKSAQKSVNAERNNVAKMVDNKSVSVEVETVKRIENASITVPELGSVNNSAFPGVMSRAANSSVDAEVNIAKSVVVKKADKRKQTMATFTYEDQNSEFPVKLRRLAWGDVVHSKQSLLSRQDTVQMSAPKTNSFAKRGRSSDRKYTGMYNKTSTKSLAKVFGRTYCNTPTLLCPQCEDFEGIWHDLLTHYEAMHSNIAVCIKCYNAPRFHLADFYQHLTKYHPECRVSDAHKRRKDREVIMRDLIEQLGVAAREKYGAKVARVHVDCRMIDVRLSPDGDASTARFVCRQCLYTSRNSDIFFGHITAHLNIGEFRCLHCSHEANRDEIRRHYRNAHKIPPPEFLPRSVQYKKYRHLVDRITDALTNMHNTSGEGAGDLISVANAQTHSVVNELRIKSEPRSENVGNSEFAGSFIVKEEIKDSKTPPNEDEDWTFSYFCIYCDYTSLEIMPCKLHVEVNHSRKQLAVSIELQLTFDEDDAEAVTDSTMATKGSKLYTKRRIDRTYRVVVATENVAHEGFQVHHIHTAKFQRGYNSAMSALFNNFSTSEVISTIGNDITCHLCNIAQTSFPALFEHWNRKHCSYLPYKCAFCQMKCRKPATIVCHEKRLHPKLAGNTYVMNQQQFDDLFKTLESYLLDWLKLNNVYGHIPDDMKLIVDCSVRLKDINLEPKYSRYVRSATSPSSSTSSSTTRSRNKNK